MTTNESPRGIGDVVAEDGHPIEVTHWPVEHGTRGAIQILHGLAEHVGRYQRFARACNQRGFAVVGHNHRGHGADAERLGHFADNNGWDAVLGDVARVRQATRDRYPDVPLVLFAHSMGSYIAQSFLFREPDAIDALVLSGSTWPKRVDVRVGRWLARALMWFRGASGVSSLFDKMSFAQFNKRFAPNRTAFDWLSRDAAEVDKYVNDPLCGEPSSNALWRDLFGGLLDISQLPALTQIPAELPILITGGELDPVGGAAALGKLAANYEATGHSRVTLTLYPEGRHEMLNETNRDRVTDDILSWIEKAVL